MRTERREPDQRRTSLRTRLTLWVVTIFVLIQLVTGVAFWAFNRANARRVFEERLLERAQSVAVEIASQLPDLTEWELVSIARRELGFIQFDRFEIGILDAHGHSLVHDVARWPRSGPPLAARALETGEPQRGTIDGERAGFDLPPGQRAEALALPIRSPSGESAALIIVTTDAYIRRQQAIVARILLIAGLFGTLASAISGWLIAGMAVEPIRRLSDVATQLTPENIDHELVVNTRNTEIAELTAELDAARARIRAAFAAQERFLSNISHEIKTPIATLLTEAQTLDRAGLPPEASEFVETAEDEMRKLGRLLESFLTLTRVRDGSGVSRPRLYPANELVMDAVEDCLTTAKQHTVRIEPELAGSELGEKACFLGDPDLLRTMLNNLIRNAIRFSPRDGKIAVVARAEGGRFEISVRDQGPGLPPELLDRVFDRFVQSAEEIRRERGHGLGLAIAKGIAELHNGDVRARNLESGGGAEFTVWIPYTSSGEHTDDSLPNSAGVNGPTEAGRPAPLDRVSRLTDT